MAETVKKATDVKETKAAKPVKSGTVSKSSVKKASTTTAKKTTTKKTTTKKATTKKASAKKASRKPTAKALLTKAAVSYSIEFQGRSVIGKDLAELAVKDYMKKTGKTALKKLDLFVQPENSVAYYAVDGEGGDQFQINI